ncbi:hypothetical protein [Arthrobacter sp. Br18]|uniref:hypothetical protein n=1 Tax=Arthrobacter sp. Br18 TaxID=1312954 RepID=UPI000479CA3E|nr:hypothetical protein [Arthrobacter sp. Br18]
MDIGTVATELYALPLEKFTDARNERARDAARSGDRDLAALLKKLPKASTAAWLVNMLVTHRRDEVEQVLELGNSLREAQEGSDRAQLQALGQQRQRLLAAVARLSLDVAGELGSDVGPAALGDVESTLRAAMTDPAAAAAVLTARLVRALEVSGWEPVSLEGAVGGPEESSSAPADAEQSGAEQSGAEPRIRLLEQARTELSRAEAEVERADDAAEEAVALAQRTGATRDGLLASIEDLQERLAALAEELDRAEEQAREVEHFRRETAEAAESARAAVEEARAAVEEARTALDAADAERT